MLEHQRDFLRYISGLRCVCKEINDYIKECIKYCSQLDYGNYEIILIPDSALEKGTRIVPSGPVTLRGVEKHGGSNNDVCAFIDSDAYSREDWLSNSVKYLNDEVVAVGGPGITPHEDSLMQKASGLVLSVIVVRFIRRYKSKSSFYSCNFITKRNIKEAGGWNDELQICRYLRVYRFVHFVQDAKNKSRKSAALENKSGQHYGIV